MQSRHSTFTFDTMFNFATDSLLSVQSDNVSNFPPVTGNFELLNGTPFLLLDGTNLLLL